MALFAVTATFAPAIGPTIGGWLNERYGWEWIFYVNLVPGAAMLALLWVSLEPAPMQLGLLKKGDWPGVATMAVGLGALQTVLEEGNKNDWFGSPFIVNLSIVAAISLLLFLWIEMTAAHPLLNLRLLTRRNFGFGTVANFLLGIGLYGTAFILPVYLSQIQGYNAEQIGIVLIAYGLPQLFIIPFVPALMKAIDLRLLVAVGFALFGLSTFMNGAISADVAGPQLLWPNLVRALGQAIIFTPLSAIAAAGIEAENAGSASALFNMMRNLGGAIGIAVLQTALTKREQFHSNVLTSALSPFREAFRQRLDGLTHYFIAHGVADPATAHHQAVVAVGRIVRRQAFLMAYGDVFLMLALAMAAAVVAALLLRKADGRAPRAGH
jgi:DHA2 family multidrug resistance protein